MLCERLKFSLTSLLRTIILALKPCLFLSLFESDKLLIYSQKDRYEWFLRKPWEEVNKNLKIYLLSPRLNNSPTMDLIIIGDYVLCKNDGVTHNHRVPVIIFCRSKWILPRDISNPRENSFSLSLYQDGLYWRIIQSITNRTCICPRVM